MKRFMAIYIGAGAAFKKWHKLDEATRKAREASGMKAWGDWMTANSVAIVDQGVRWERQSARLPRHRRHQEQHDGNVSSGQVARSCGKAVREAPALHDLPRQLGGDHGVPAYSRAVTHHPAAESGSMTCPGITLAEAPPRNIPRSTLAVVAGFVAIFVLSLGTDQVFHSLGVYPPWGEPMRETRTQPARPRLSARLRQVRLLPGRARTAHIDCPPSPGRLGFGLSWLGAVGGVCRLGPASYPILLADVVTAFGLGWRSAGATLDVLSPATASVVVHGARPEKFLAMASLPV